jgi:acyl transferase domain-containing protein
MQAFLHDSSGYSRSESCGLVVVIKRLSDALREDDRIHGVIRSVCIRGMASPDFISRPHAQFESVALAQAVKLSGVDTAAISFVEAHGPGVTPPKYPFVLCWPNIELPTIPSPSARLRAI